MDTYQVPTLWESTQMIAITLTAFGIASAFVASKVWLPYWTKCQEEPPETYITPCEYRYPIEEATDESTEINPRSYVMESTPVGTVLMRYDPTTEAFEYWGKRGIAYKYLETVARKYVTLYQCSRYYHDYNPYADKHQENTEKDCESDDDMNKADADSDKPVETEENKEDKQGDKDDEDDEDKDTTSTSTDSVFATFKTYNKSHVNKKQTSSDTPEIKRNRYTHRGELGDFYKTISKQAEIDETLKQIVAPKSGIDFATYKKLWFS